MTLKVTFVVTFTERNDDMLVELQGGHAGSLQIPDGDSDAMAHALEQHLIQMGLLWLKINGMTPTSVPAAQLN
jgi:hypothetical protein